MNIDRAIEILTLLKNKGETDIILAAWTAERFGLSGNDSWPALAEKVEQEMDWSATHDCMWEIMRNEMTDEELKELEDSQE